VEKTALIVTDGAESTAKMAKAIAGELKNYKVIVAAAGDFEGTQLLAAGLCFFGAAQPEPTDLSYLHAMLQHINLAGRPCAIFAGSQKAADYLRAMLHDAEPALYSEPCVGDDDVRAWVKKVIDAT
jgi:hypothetical protein